MKTEQSPSSGQTSRGGAAPNFAPAGGPTSPMKPAQPRRVSGQASRGTATSATQFKHSRLAVWQLARELVKQIYELSRSFPSSEMHGLTNQIRRAAISVPSNIAEGSSRQTKADFVHFLVMARGSLAEIDTQLVLAEDLGYVMDSAKIHSCVEDLSIRINHLIAHIRSGD